MPDKSSEEVVSRCVVDVMSRKIYVYSDQGAERIVECESIDEFMSVLKYVRDQVNENILFYSYLF